MSELVTAPGLSQELRGQKKVFLQDVWRPGTVGRLLRNMDEFSVFARFQVVEPQWSSSVQTCKRHAVCSLLLLLPDVQLFTWLSFSKHSRHELKFDIIRRRRKMHKPCCHIHLKHSVTHSCYCLYDNVVTLWLWNCVFFLEYQPAGGVCHCRDVVLLHNSQPMNIDIIMNLWWIFVMYFTKHDMKMSCNFCISLYK